MFFGLLGTEVAARKKLREQELLASTNAEKETAGGTRKRTKPQRYDDDSSELSESDESEQLANDQVFATMGILRCDEQQQCRLKTKFCEVPILPLTLTISGFGILSVEFFLQLLVRFKAFKNPSTF